MSRRDLLYELLNRALTEEMGLVVTTNNPKLMETQLHEIKKAHKEYDSLEITTPSTPETLIIVKKSVQLDEPINGDLE